MEDTASSFSMPSLICQEDQNLWLDDDDEDDDKNDTSIVLNGSILPDQEESYIDILVSKESAFASEDSSIVTDNWLMRARANAIQWIMRTKDCFGFGYETAYLSVSYFDRFLTRRSIDKEKSWVVRLLSVACLSLAAKMEELAVPALAEYDTGECGFDADTLRRMELLVLSTLDWRMSFATPFVYLNYFASKLRISTESEKLVSKSIGYIFSIIEDINLVDYRSSTIAAAAILAASDQRLTDHLLDLKLSILSSCGCIENKHVISCYALMTQQSHEESVASESFVSSESSFVSCPSSRSNKRRRLRL